MTQRLFQVGPARFEKLSPGAKKISQRGEPGARGPTVTQ